MKQILFIALLFWGFSACDPPGDPEPAGPVTINGASWNVSGKNAQYATAGTLPWHKIYIKLDGADGASLVFVCAPDSNFDASSTLQGNFEYIIGPTWNSTVFSGTGTVHLLSFDETQRKLGVSFESTVSNGNNSLIIKSEESLTDIPFGNISWAATAWQAQVQSGGQDWNISENGADMETGAVNWFMLNRVLNPEEKIEFQIPWNLAAGKHTIQATDKRTLKFYNGNPLIEWVMESAEIQIQENDFVNATQKGTFKGVFRHPLINSLKVELDDCSFEVSYK